MIKPTGIARQIDGLGRVTIPTELRCIMKINIGDPLEIYVDDANIVLKKYQPGCFFCENAEGLTNFKGKNVCMPCLSKIKELAEGE